MEYDEFSAIKDELNTIGYLLDDVIEHVELTQNHLGDTEHESLDKVLGSLASMKALFTKVGDRIAVLQAPSPNQALARHTVPTPRL